MFQYSYAHENKILSHFFIIPRRRGVLVPLRRNVAEEWKVSLVRIKIIFDFDVKSHSAPSYLTVYRVMSNDYFFKWLMNWKKPKSTGKSKNDSIEDIIILCVIHSYSYVRVYCVLGSNLDLRKFKLTWNWLV